MQRDVMDNLIQENTSSAMDQNIPRSDRFTVNLIEPEDEITQLDVSPVEKPKKSMFGWMSQKVKAIVVMVVVCLVVIFIAVYMYKRKQKKDQDEIARIKQKITESQFRDRVDLESAKTTESNHSLSSISKEDLSKKANELAKQLQNEDEQEEQLIENSDQFSDQKGNQLTQKYTNQQMTNPAKNDQELQPISSKKQDKQQPTDNLGNQQTSPVRQRPTPIKKVVNIPNSLSKPIHQTVIVEEEESSDERGQTDEDNRFNEENQLSERYNQQSTQLLEERLNEQIMDRQDDQEDPGDNMYSQVEEETKKADEEDAQSEGSIEF